MRGTLHRLLRRKHRKTGTQTTLPDRVSRAHNPLRDVLASAFCDTRLFSERQLRLALLFGLDEGGRTTAQEAFFSRDPRNYCHHFVAIECFQLRRNLRIRLCAITEFTGRAST